MSEVLDQQSDFAHTFAPVEQNGQEILALTGALSCQDASSSPYPPHTNQEISTLSDLTGPSIDALQVLPAMVTTLPLPPEAITITQQSSDPEWVVEVPEVVYGPDTDLQPVGRIDSLSDARNLQLLTDAFAVVDNSFNLEPVVNNGRHLSTRLDGNEVVFADIRQINGRTDKLEAFYPDALKSVRGAFVYPRKPWGPRGALMYINCDPSFPYSINDLPPQELDVVMSVFAQALTEMTRDGNIAIFGFNNSLNVVGRGVRSDLHIHAEITGGETFDRMTPADIDRMRNLEWDGGLAQMLSHAIASEFERETLGPFCDNFRHQTSIAGEKAFDVRVDNLGPSIRLDGFRPAHLAHTGTRFMDMFLRPLLLKFDQHFRRFHEDHYWGDLRETYDYVRGKRRWEPYSQEEQHALVEGYNALIRRKPESSVTDEGRKIDALVANGNYKYPFGYAVTIRFDADGATVYTGILTQEKDFGPDQNVGVKFVRLPETVPPEEMAQEIRFADTVVWPAVERTRLGQQSQGNDVY